ncbi:hypothetical protein AYI68_g2954 [Smittium mucronatum]|uniref:Uncharacterized protein n=1 Tax=Smittium mucronatum TaxID=133383 RepID=A0A1R0H1A3_9FUNG|nr:hypothetical protein AYI68_g2954 [Smittium mucronatum]
MSEISRSPSPSVTLAARSTLDLSQNAFSSSNLLHPYDCVGRSRSERFPSYDSCDQNMYSSNRNHSFSIFRKTTNQSQDSFETIPETDITYWKESSAFKLTPVSSNRPASPTKVNLPPIRAFLSGL